MSRRGPKRTRTMTAGEFETVRPFLSISEDRIKAARSYLVCDDGKTPETLQGIASREGVTKQAIDDAVRHVWELHEKYKKSLAVDLAGELPPGWELLNISAPSALVPAIRALIATYHKTTEAEEDAKSQK